MQRPPLAGWSATNLTSEFWDMAMSALVQPFAVKLTDRTAATRSRLASISEPFHEPFGDRLLPGEGGVQPVGVQQGCIWGTAESAAEVDHYIAVAGRCADRVVHGVQ